jgi:acetylornithine aminotransferase
MFEKFLQTNSFESILIEKAKGSWFWDINGKKYLDLASGTWCVNLGHNHPTVIQALKNQIDKIVHRGMKFLTPVTLEAANKVLNFLSNEYDKITFLNSGSEAMEFAITFAQKATGQIKILSLKDSYLGAYGQAKASSYTSSKGSKLKIPYPECNEPDCNCLEEYTSLIDYIIDNYSSELACFALEPVLVSGGIHKPCTKFIEELCKRLQKAGVLLVVNEITTGMGRTGYRFGYEHYNIKPDIIALGKAIGNGYPVSVIVTKSEVEAKISTDEMYYAQSHQLDPVGAIAAKTVIGIFEDEKIIEKSHQRIKLLNEFFENFTHPCIEEIRSIGMLFAIQIKKYKNYSIHELIVKIKDDLLHEGIMIGYSLGKDLVRLLPPLTITNDEIEFFKEKFAKVLTKL